MSDNDKKDTQIMKKDNGKTEVVGFGDSSTMADFNSFAQQGYVLDETVILGDPKDGKPDMLAGILQGPGEPMELEDPATGELRSLKTWRIQASDRVMVTLLGAAQLDTKLSRLPAGTKVAIKWSGKVKSRKGMQVNDYRVAFLLPKGQSLADGRRSSDAKEIIS